MKKWILSFLKRMLSGYSDLLVCDLLRYGFFSLPAAISLLTMQVYMPAFLAENPAFSFSLIGLLFFGARLFAGPAVKQIRISTSRDGFEGI